MIFLPALFLVLFQACVTLAHGGHNVPKPVQLCEVDQGRNTDACLAMISYINASTNEKDLRLHLSARFFDERQGWVAFGIGEKMDEALMFVMYPGVRDNGELCH